MESNSELLLVSHRIPDWEDKTNAFHGKTGHSEEGANA